MPKYICQICEVVSEQKSHHDSHLKRAKHKQAVKIFTLELEKLNVDERIEKYGKPDISAIVKECSTVIEKPKEVAFEKKTKTNTIIYENSEETISKSNSSESFKHKFLEFLGKMHNLLRGASVTGDQALDDILHSLCLCYLEDKISEEGQFDLANSEKSCYKGIIQRKVKDYVKYLKVSYLIDHPEELLLKDSTSSIQKCGKLLSKHPITSQIFKDNENFINCQDIQILCQLLKQCQEFSKNHNIFEEVDITGIAYEYITTKHAGNGGTSKEMGQYFTERPLMEMCFQMIDKSDIEELGIDENSTLGDEFCATLGFPLMAREFLKRHNINIKDKNIYGVEWHERLSKFAYMNAMFSMNNFKNVKRGNSFITNVTPHLDISVHNVPFGKSMTPKMIEKGYQAFLSENPNKGYPDFKDYVPFNTKKIDAILASQVVLYKTKKMGLMIIKDGEETSGKSNDKYRKWLMENCIIKKIMKIPSGAFTCTGTKTVCIYFIKKESQMTENIQFLQLSDDGNKITEICHVSMADMKQNNYSWDPNSYIVDEEMEKMMSKSKCEWKKLGEVCNLIGGKQLSKKNFVEGEYFVIGGGQTPTGKHNSFNKEANTILCSQSGSYSGFISRYNTPIWASDCFSIHSKNKDIMNENYLYYYLKMALQENIYKLQKGAGQPHVYPNDVVTLSLPIPSIEIQNQVVQILDDLAEQKQLLSDRKSGIERQMKYYFETQIKKHIDNITFEPLSSLCMINSHNLSKQDNYNTIKYLDLSSVDKGNITNIQEIEFNKKPSRAQRKVKIGDVLLGTVRPNLKNHTIITDENYCDNLIVSTGFCVLSSGEELLNKYLYYNIISDNFTNKMMDKATGSSYPSLNTDTIKGLTIPKLPIMKQTEIVQYLDNLEEKKNSIDEEISDIDTLMKQVLEQSYN